MRKGLPKVGKRVTTPAGDGKVVELDVLRQKVRVWFDEGGSEIFPPDVLEVLAAAAAAGQAAASCRWFRPTTKPDTRAAVRFYITTPIYYVSDVPHLGHAYTTIVCDALARYHRLRGHDDALPHRHRRARPEDRAQAGGRQGHAAPLRRQVRRRLPRDLEGARDLERRLHPHHRRRSRSDGAGAVARDGEERRHLQGEYEGWYCVACERFYTEKELVPGQLCPDHKRPVERVKEQSFYFKLSAFTQPLLELYEEHPEFIQPANRRNEVMAFVKEGLRDLSISRTTFAWGVPVPDQPEPRHLRVARRAHQLLLGDAAQRRRRARSGTIRRRRSCT